MDDLAAILGMSKKTIYNVFSDKNSLFLDMVDYLFDTIKESEQKIVKDTSLSTIEKIRHILGVMPESYKEIDVEQLYLLKDKYQRHPRRIERCETIARWKHKTNQGCNAMHLRWSPYPRRKSTG